MLSYIINHTPLFYFVQSLWRDEAFSVLIAERPIATFITKLTFEPPVYYTVLHVWIKIFGTSEIAVRSLSFIAFAIACFIVIEWAHILFKKSWLSFYLPLLFFANPMLIYYAFEVRTYGMYIMFATLSLFAYQQKRWKLFTVATLLGFYTHTYFIFLFTSQIIHFLAINRKHITTKQWLTTSVSDPAVKAIAISILGIAPWMVRVLIESSKLKNSWYYPVDLHLLQSVLGNMFIGYEGTPWFLWGFTSLLSLVLLIFCGMSILPEKTRQRNGIFFLSVFIPLTIVLGVSFIKPLFVNRYVIPVTIGLIFSVVFALETIKNNYVRVLCAVVILGGEIWFNSWYPLQHKKIPIRDTITQINILRKSTDVVYATNPLVLFETIYYSHPREGVFLYNPSQAPFPWYIGDAAFSNSLLAVDIPLYPKRAFLVNPDGSFSISYQLPKPATIQKLQGH
jgi:mannosyltransferase